MPALLLVRLGSHSQEAGSEPGLAHTLSLVPLSPVPCDHAHPDDHFAMWEGRSYNSGRFFGR